MDSEMNPDYYRDTSPESAVSDTRATIDHVKRIDDSFELLSPIITPRYAPSCSSSLLHSLGALAAEANLPIQTHIAENPAEVALVAKLFPSHDSYAAVYDDHGLLKPRTILAHAIHLSPSEQELIRKRGSSVSHCPVSNSCISSGICPVRELLDQSIEVGLGTDMSGGWSPSILVAAREAAMVSRILAAFERDFRIDEPEHQNDETTKEDRPLGKNARSPETHLKPKSSQKDHHDELCERKKLSIEECLYLATAGGAKCLGLHDKIGRFDVGMEWDAQMIQLEDFSRDANESDDSVSDAEIRRTMTDHERLADGHDQLRRQHGGEWSEDQRGHIIREDKGPVELWGPETWTDKVAKWVYCGDDRNTKKVWVKGRFVHERGDLSPDI